MCICVYMCIYDTLIDVYVICTYMRTNIHMNTHVLMCPLVRLLNGTNNEETLYCDLVEPPVAVTERPVKVKETGELPELKCPSFGVCSPPRKRRYLCCCTGLSCKASINRMHNRPLILFQTKQTVGCFG